MLQPNEPDARNLGGRRALGGEAPITDLSETNSNKALLEGFYTDALDQQHV